MPIQVLARHVLLVRNLLTSALLAGAAMLYGSVSVGQESLGHAEGALAKQATLSTILRIAIHNNPGLAEARERERAQRVAAPAASRLPDPEFEYRLWAAPLGRPYALHEAEMHMFGLRQSFPAPGSLKARSEGALAQGDIAAEGRRAREQELLARVRRTYAQYYQADREYRIHVEHAGLAQQTLNMSRAAYKGGRGAQQDMLRAAVATARLHNDLAAIDSSRRTLRGLLNTLMSRPPGAALGPPAPIQPAMVELHVAALLREAIERRPEIGAAKSAIRASETEVEGARAVGRWPSFMVGADYMLMPMREAPHHYGLMFSMSLPWLNPSYGEEVRAAEARLAADRYALSSARDAARYELFEAVERLQAAREAFTTIERDILPQAHQSFESSQASYRGGQSDSLSLLDALRSLLDVRVERERALVRIETALADLEFALGGPVISKQTPVQTQRSARQ